jgi:hypothetical protein
LTAWKRVFIEKRRMLRNGLFLAQDAKAGDTFIVTRGHAWRGNEGNHDYLSRDETIVITHGPQLDRSDLNAGWYHETHTILSVEDLGNGTYRVNLGTKQGNTVAAEQLNHDFKIEPNDANIGDGISKIGTLTLGPADYFDAEDNLVTGEAFLGAFTENIYLPDPTAPGALPLVPFIETRDEDILQNLAEKWSSVAIWSILPNHQLLVIASDDDPNGEASDAGLTMTNAGAWRTSSYVFRAAIARRVHGKNAAANEESWARKTSAHEIAHQWQTNGLWSASDHCPVPTRAYDDTNVYCLLATNDDNALGQWRSARTASRGSICYRFLRRPWHGIPVSGNPTPD